MQEIPNGISNIGDTIFQPANSTLNPVNNAPDNIATPVPSVGSKPSNPINSTVKPVFNGCPDVADFVRNSVMYTVPNIGNLIFNLAHKIGDAVINVLPCI